MKPSLALVLRLLGPGTAFGQAARPPVGVCLDPDRFEAAQAAAFDTTGARQACERFLIYWKAADPDDTQPT